MTDDVKILKEALAKGPTEGEWWIGELKYSHISQTWNTAIHTKRAEVKYGSTRIICLLNMLESYGDPLQPNPFNHNTFELPKDANAEFIAACSPDRISRILEQLEAYEGALKILGRYHGGDGSITRELASEQFAVVAKYNPHGDSSYAGEGE